MKPHKILPPAPTAANFKEKHWPLPRGASLVKTFRTWRDETRAALDAATAHWTARKKKK